MVMERVKAVSYIRRSTAILNQRQPSGVADAGGPASTLLSATSSGDVIGRAPTKPTCSSDLEGVRAMLWVPLNALLIFVPIGLLFSYLGWGDLPSFVLNGVAIIPLAGVIGAATEELALHTGDLLGGLLNATFGNAVEMIITVIALKAGLVSVVRGSLLGSILSNLLLVLGMAFFFGGLYHHVQHFNVQGATCSTSLLVLAAMAFLTPTVAVSENDSPDDVLWLSRMTALLLALLYSLFLIFQLGTHFDLFQENHFEALSLTAEGGRGRGGGERAFSDDFAGGASGGYAALEQAEEPGEVPSVTAWTAAGLLVVVTLLVSLNSECLVESIEGVSRDWHIPESFIGVILLPIVGNAAEHSTAVIVAMKNKPDLALGVAVGSSTQIALFMVPFAVLVGWVIDVPMSLAFSKVSATVLAFAILIVLGIVQDGQSNWLEGIMLITAYGIVAVVYCLNHTVA